MNPDTRDPDGGGIVDQAIGWHLRQAEMTGDDWRDFTRWLDAAPAHAQAFDRIVLDDDLLDLREDATIATPTADNDRYRPTPARRRWLAAGGAVAAAAFAVYGLPTLLPAAHAPYEIATQPGQRQELALADGTRIEMSGGTLLRLDRADPRRAELKRGEATFHVRHDAADPFTLTSGGLTVRDLGTVFNVARDGARLAVQVAEGSVLFQPDREAVTLKPGSALSTVEGSDQVMLSRIDVGAVGAWRDGRLSFVRAPLDQVVGAVRRQSGIPIVLASTLAAKPFTGVVHLTGAADRDVPHIAALVGATVRRVPGGWLLESGETGAR